VVLIILVLQKPGCILSQLVAEVEIGSEIWWPGQDFLMLIVLMLMI